MRPRRTAPCLLGLLGLLAPVLLAGLTGCGSKDTSSSAGPPGSAGSAGSPAHRASVTVTAAKGCTIDSTHLAAGGIDIAVRNVDATAVSEVEVLDGDRIIGEKENLPPGFSGSFSITAPAGAYTLYCPGAATEKTALTVTGRAAAGSTSAAALAARASRGYARYVDTQVGYLLRAVRTLDAALRGHDLRAAQVAYAKARPFYEKIEPVAESFPGLDADIDARANDVPPSRFRGFHRIEKGLFADRSLAGLRTYGAGLVADVASLQRRTDALAKQPMPYQLTELANGAQGLLDEVASTKITGEEERYSHLDVLDVANNVEGAEQAFAQLAPILERSDRALTTRIQRAFAAVDALVDRYRDRAAPSGFVSYSRLTGADKRALAAAVKAVQEPLSRVASKVAG